VIPDIIIIGGGVIGSSIAFHLLEDGFDGRVTVMERDSSYQFASSALAFGGVRQQFTLPVSVRMVQYSLKVIDQLPECQFRRRGYLFLGDESNWDALQKRYELQRAANAECELVSIEEIRRLVPDLRTDDLRGGLFGPQDGYVDPRATLRAFREKAQRLGATYVSQDVQKVEAGPVYVIASGAYSGGVAEIFGAAVPITPVRQQLVRCALPRPWTYEFPVVIEPGGAHWRSSPGNEITVAKPDHQEPPGIRFGCELDRFHNDVMPALVKWIPEFRDLKVVFGWGGLYEMTPDDNGIIDRISDRLYIAAGFSGHGLMMSAATGKLMSELIRTGRFETIDASSLSLARFARNELLRDASVLRPLPNPRP
jgi:glycine/D-amino acid oxidase-like deaminating enzyme